MPISRRHFAALGAVAFCSTALAPFRTRNSNSLAQPLESGESGGSDEPWAIQLIRAAESQIGVTVGYDGAYRKLAFPGGDFDRSIGVCSDVIIRAYRDALGFDLQKAVNRDMKKHFSSYPKAWGLTRTDANIDHRRVLNLERFFLRLGADLPVPASNAGYRPGDLITQRIGLFRTRLPHIAVISHKMTADGQRPLIIHNIGAGTRQEDALADRPTLYRFRFDPQTA